MNLLIYALHRFADTKKGSQTLDLVNDCFRFVTGFFEVICTSAPHIYHSTLLLCPKESIVQGLYGSQAKPLARIVQGAPISWNPSIAAIRFPGRIRTAVWSPCSRFIATVNKGSPGIAILDAATLEQLHTMQPPKLPFDWDHIVFSPGSRLLTSCAWLAASFVTWDLQTGGLVSTISTEGYGYCNSMSYSECGTIVGGLFSDKTIVTYNVLTGTCLYSHSMQQEIYWTIWTHGEYLQFATVESESVTMWQVNFTSNHNHTPSNVGSLSIPDNYSGYGLVLLPTLSRLAFILDEKVLVWDSQHHKFLLKSEEIESPKTMYFSLDGCFLTCVTGGKGSLLWKESSSGYLPCQKLISSAYAATPVFSPHGELVLLKDNQILQLCPTENPPASSSNPLKESPTWGGFFLIEFSPDESLVAFTVKSSSTVTILDIKSGNPWLVIDTEMKTYGLKITEEKIIAVGDGKIVTWELPARDCIFNGTRNIENSVQTTTFKHLDPYQMYASISPDLSYFAFGGIGSDTYLGLYNMHTGEELTAGISQISGHVSGFSPGGSEVWCANVEGKIVDQWEIENVKENDSSTIRLKQVLWGGNPQRGFPWHSACGYQVTDEGWIICSSGKWVLWLPHFWQQGWIVQRKWSGKFFTSWNMSLPEPFILELDV